MVRRAESPPKLLRRFGGSGVRGGVRACASTRVLRRSSIGARPAAADDGTPPDRHVLAPRAWSRSVMGGTAEPPEAPSARSSSVAASRCPLSALAASRSADARAASGGNDASKVSAPRRTSAAPRVSRASTAGASDGARRVLPSVLITCPRTYELRSPSRSNRAFRSSAVSTGSFVICAATLSRPFTSMLGSHGSSALTGCCTRALTSQPAAPACDSVTGADSTPRASVAPAFAGSRGTSRVSASKVPGSLHPSLVSRATASDATRTSRS